MALKDREFHFDWDEDKALANVRKHGVSFELARTIFSDPRLLTVADLEHNDSEERWFSIACAATERCSRSFTYGPRRISR